MSRWQATKIAGAVAAQVDLLELEGHPQAQERDGLQHLGAAALHMYALLC